LIEAANGPNQERKMTKEKQEPKSKGAQERQLSEELKQSFPASDPPASTQPGSGITGPEAVKPTPNKTR
jgi:hypothetical protein